MRLSRIPANTLIRHISSLPHPSFKMASTNVPKTCKVILADTIAKKLLGEVHEMLVKTQSERPAKPTLAAFLANDDPAAAQYAEWSKKTCEEK